VKVFDEYNTKISISDTSVQKIMDERKKYDESDE
jgi:hypothetical protein